RPLRLNDRLGGHYVSGHVDGFAQLLSVQEVGNSWVYRFRLEDPALSPLIVEKGSICLSGISLTINTVEGNVFSVAIIPHTMEKTTLGQVEVGDRVNVEMDILGKYVQRLLSYGSLSHGEGADGSEVSAVEDKTGLGLVKTTKIFSGSWFNHD
ncbi:MAG: hypothetical protein K2X66_19235, partial [Cyanobacteria bacterium]|nr:hypothetical protein [Cyanobacteriota bacterium]